MSKKVGLLKMALMMALGGSISRDESGWSEHERGQAMLMGLRNAYKRIPHSSSSNAASQKRASRRNRNIAKHNRSACGH